MGFASDKSTFLAKEDKSLKGSIDRHIKFLCDAINANDSFYTTSSCSGRIVLLNIPDSGKKNESEWLFVSHDEAGEYAISSELTDLPDGEIWFRFEPLIIHVACETVADAGTLIKALQDAGFKHSGVISLSRKIVVEIIGNQRLDTIIAKDRTLLVTDAYISMLVETANRKMTLNLANIGKIEAAVKKI